MKTHQIHALTTISLSAAATIGCTVGAVLTGSLAGTIVLALLATAALTCMLAAIYAATQTWEENTADFFKAFKDSLVTTATAVLSFVAIQLWTAFLEGVRLVIMGAIFQKCSTRTA